MNELDFIVESFLTEDAALTKGSQRVMADKKLVANLADSIRDDAQAHPSAFPAGFSRTAQKTPDDKLAHWFLENIDKIEREGYEGTVYSRDGVNSDWIVRRYIAGSHNWEDLTGVMNMNLRDWYLLKNRNMLEPNHKDLPKFNSVRDVGYYMTTHYKNELEKVRDAAKNAARNKMAKSIKLVDNDDYRIYTTLNRAAGCLLGLGTQWCTANSNYGGHFHSYGGRAMLFQMFPYAKEKDKEGKLVDIKDEDGKKVLADNEKYQFDAGGPNFMDVTDHPANADKIRKRFPYLYSDLASALKQNKTKMEQAFKELSDDPTLQHEDYKIKTYEIDDEIKKLEKFVEKGYFTDEKRPSARSHAENPEQPQMTQPPQEQPQGEQPQQGQAQMEGFREMVRKMLEGSSDVEEDEEMPDETGGELGSMGGGAGPSGGTKYAPGTAPTMPESFINKGTIMENVDKDVAAMLSSLKKYDKLVESVAPVLMARPLEEKKKAEKGGKPEWLTKAEEKAEEKGEKSGKDKSFKAKSEKDSKKVEVDEKKEVEEKKEKVEEGADQEVLQWMKRFASLGNMKGYGR